MAFQYINPGLANLFDDTIVDVVQGTDATLTYSRTSGDYFYCTNTTRAKLYMEKNKEYWTSFYWYPSKSYGAASYIWMIGLYAKDTTTGIYLKRASTSSTSNITLSFHNGTNTAQYGSSVGYNFVLGRGYHIEIYAKDDALDGKIFLWVNGQQVYEYNGNFGDGLGFDRLYFGGSRNSIDCLSDIVVQNTGQIGDMRVNRMPINTEKTVCDWDGAVVPVGRKPQKATSYIYEMKTYILKQCQFNSQGKVHAVVVSTGYSPTILTFFLFRKNNDTGKYSTVEVRATCTVPNSSIAKVIFTEPMQTQAGDYLGLYLDDGGVHHKSVTDSEKYSVVATENLTQVIGEVDMPTQIYRYEPCLCALFEPNDGASGISSLIQMQKDNPDLSNCGYFVVNSANKKLVCEADISKLNGMAIGHIGAIAITSFAHYEGDSEVKKLAAVVKSDTNEHEGTSQELTTEDRAYYMGVFDNNPLTNAQWTVVGISDIQIGVKSKV